VMCGGSCEDMRDRLPYCDADCVWQKRFEGDGHPGCVMGCGDVVVMPMAWKCKSMSLRLNETEGAKIIVLGYPGR
jgi:hypothetical protein